VHVLIFVHALYSAEAAACVLGFLLCAGAAVDSAKAVGACRAGQQQRARVSGSTRCITEAGAPAAVLGYVRLQHMPVLHVQRASSWLPDAA
jgi:hypothetical protein